MKIAEFVLKFVSFLCVRAMIEQLEATNEELALVAAKRPIPSQDILPAAAVKLEEEPAAIEWQRKYEKAAARLEELEMEMARASLRGAYVNPADTMVLHFKQNPFSSALEMEEKRRTDILQENEALKAR